MVYIYYYITTLFLNDAILKSLDVVFTKRHYSIVKNSAEKILYEILP